MVAPFPAACGILCLLSWVALIIAAIAVGVYSALFKGVLPQNEKLATEKSRVEVDVYERDPLQGNRRGADSPIPDPAEHECLTRAFQNAFERGDHLTVLRCWNTTKRPEQAPPAPRRTPPSPVGSSRRSS